MRILILNTSVHSLMLNAAHLRGHELYVSHAIANHISSVLQQTAVVHAFPEFEAWSSIQKIVDQHDIDAAIIGGRTAYLSSLASYVPTYSTSKRLVNVNAHVRHIADMKCTTNVSSAFTNKNTTNNSQIHPPPIVSVCMPIYKGVPELVTRAIQSILQQTYSRFELVVALDEDNSPLYPLLIECYGNDPRIHIVNQGRRGLCATRNHLLSLITGPIVTFLDADNVWNPEYLERVVLLYTNNPHAQCAYCALQYQSTGHILFRPFDINALLQANYIDMNVFSFRRSLYLRHGGFDETLTSLEDWDLALTYAHHTTPVTFDYIGAVYSDDPNDKRYRVTLNENLRQNSYRITNKYKRRSQPTSHVNP